MHKLTESCSYESLISLSTNLGQAFTLKSTSLEMACYNKFYPSGSNCGCLMKVFE
jgi:hypothetical protein